MASEGIETRRKVVNASPRESSAADVPSGFILKLFQMVEGAPDEVIAVSSLGAVRCVLFEA